MTWFVFSFSLSRHNANLPLQRELQAVFECTKELELHVAVTDIDISLIQENVALATTHPELSASWTEAIALVLSMMNPAQRELFRFERLYPDAIAIAVFGDTEENPIVIDGDQVVLVDEDEV